MDPGVGRGGVPSVTVYDLAAGRYREISHAEGDENITVTLPIDGARPVMLSPQSLAEF